MDKVNRHTRAARNGEPRKICCPACDATSRVYHFAWSALQCPECKTMTDKYAWLLVPLQHNYL